MAKGVRVHVIHEVHEDAKLDQWQLCFQWCQYFDFDSGDTYKGFRLIWRRPPDRGLQAARGRARLLSIAQGKRLMEQAEADGWGQNQAPA